MLARTIQLPLPGSPAFIGPMPVVQNRLSQLDLNALYEELKHRYDGYRCVKCKRQPWTCWGGKDNPTHVLRCSCGVGAWANLESSQNWMKEKVASLIERQGGGGALAVYDNETALARVQEGKTAGLFPQNVTTEQLGMLAKAAVAYGLDPLFGELIIYQGKPYITIEGRRRLDANAGHHPSIRYRPLTDDEERYYKSVDALNPRDVALVCIGTDEHGATIEAIGILLAEEREIHGNNASTPQVKRPIEMVQKRGEMRYRKQAYGPHPLPEGMERIMGDDDSVVEGSSRVLDATPISGAKTALADKAEEQQKGDGTPKAPRQQTKRTPKAADPEKVCQEHGKGWALDGDGIQFHPIEGGARCEKGATPQENGVVPPEQTPEGADPSEEAPTTFAQLQSRLDSEQVAWDGFQLQYLGTSWKLYTEQGGTVASAWSIYLEKTAAVDLLESELVD